MIQTAVSVVDLFVILVDTKPIILVSVRVEVIALLQLKTVGTGEHVNHCVLLDGLLKEYMRIWWMGDMQSDM